MPEGAVYVGRGTIWGNPYRVENGRNRQIVKQLYRQLVDRDGGLSVRTIQGELRGKDLACWCKIGEPCHADVLLEIANA